MKRFISFCLLLLLWLPAWAMTLKEIDELLLSYDLEAAERELQILLKEGSDQAEVLKRLGYVRVLKLNQNPSEEENVKLCQEARQYLTKAIEQGCKDPLAKELLKSLPEKGGIKDKPFSEVPEADQAMREAERFFAKRDWSQAAVNYRKAAELDPTLYRAQLYLGDALLQMKKPAEACEAYDKAIAIDPNIETAYRYKGNALMTQGDIEAGLNSYAAAVVAEPASEMAWTRGIGRWTDATGASFQLPKIEPPVDLDSNEDSIQVDLSGDQQSVAPWLAYGVTRKLWKEKKFAERHPGEEYRRTLEEEVEALQKVAEIAAELKQDQSLKLSEDLDLLVKLKEDKLMAPFVLFCRGGKNLRDGYAEYRKSHRADLVKFLVEYGIQREGL